MITIKAIKDAWHVLRNHGEYIEQKELSETVMLHAYMEWRSGGFLLCNVHVGEICIPWREVYAYAERKGYPTTNKTTD